MRNVRRGLTEGRVPAVQVVMIGLAESSDIDRDQAVEHGCRELLRLAREHGFVTQGHPEVVVARQPGELPPFEDEDPVAGNRERQELVELLSDGRLEVVFVTQKIERATTPGLIGESLVAQTRERLAIARVLDHPGESGRAREEAIRQHLQAFLPSGLGLETGFVIDGLGGRSRQIDLILYFSDYHPIFRVGGLPLVPVEAVIAVFEVKAEVGSTAVLADCYEVLASVKELDRSNLNKNYLLNDREPIKPDRTWWEHFQLQVLGVVVAERSITPETWLDATQQWCSDHSRRSWPNFFVSAASFVGAYRGTPYGASSPGMTADTTIAEELAVLPSVEPHSPLAWLTEETLNFVRVARRVDYSPRDYLGAADAGDLLQTRVLNVS